MKLFSRKEESRGAASRQPAMNPARRVNRQRRGIAKRTALRRVMPEAAPTKRRSKANAAFLRSIALARCNRGSAASWRSA